MVPAEKRSRTNDPRKIFELIWAEYLTRQAANVFFTPWTPFNFRSCSAGYLAQKKTAREERKGPFYPLAIDFAHWFGDDNFYPIRTLKKKWNLILQKNETKFYRGPFFWRPFFRVSFLWELFIRDLFSAYH